MTDPGFLIRAKTVAFALLAMVLTATTVNAMVNQFGWTQAAGMTCALLTAWLLGRLLR